MLLAMTPFSPDMNLGAAYNEAMDLLPEDGWAVLMDHDIMFTTLKWNEQIRNAIDSEPHGTFTGVTNRIWSPWQRVREGERLPDDIVQHRALGEKLLRSKPSLLDVTAWRPGWGGMLMIVSKAAWRDAGGFRDGMECVDHHFHQAVAAAGRKLYCIEGLYVYHFRTSRIRGLGPWSPGCCNRGVKP